LLDANGLYFVQPCGKNVGNCQQKQFKIDCILFSRAAKHFRSCEQSNGLYFDHRFCSAKFFWNLRPKATQMNSIFGRATKNLEVTNEATQIDWENSRRLPKKTQKGLATEK
jgi:hypothetical protein